MTRRCLPLLVALALLPRTAARADVFSYVAAPDPSFAWKAGVTGTGYTTIDLTSQTWQNIAWKHTIAIVRPPDVTHDDICVLVVTGGSFHPSAEWMMYSALAAQLKLPLAVLWNIPNQPLFDNLHEDGLIAYTFAKAIETGDETWPALFPMTKSAVRAMDALQAYSQQTWGKPFKRFVVTGASKRGWTTWFTGCVDPRVCAIMPMVYDNLNIPVQMEHQLKTWGDFSHQIHDYTDRGLQQKMVSPEGRKLAQLVDPYTYRDKLTMPKMIFCGTNDAYWTVDALNFYRNDLLGETNHLYVPNSGHGLTDIGRVLNTARAFLTAIADGRPRPAFTWTWGGDAAKPQLTITAPTAVKAELWTATAAAGKFDTAKWTNAAMIQAGATWTGSAAVPTDGQQLAAFGEATFPDGDHTFTLSTTMKLLPEVK
jgi:PhoPQ-activated pathogenicity-related protein